MLTAATLFLIAQSPSCDRPSIDQDIAQDLDCAVNALERGVLGKACAADPDLADHATRAASMNEEQAIRLIKFAARLPDPQKRAVQLYGAVELTLASATYWLKAAECQPEQRYFLDRAEKSLAETESYATQLSELMPDASILSNLSKELPGKRALIATRRAKLVDTEKLRQPNWATPPEQPVDCPAENLDAARHNARLAALAGERAARAGQPQQTGKAAEATVDAATKEEQAALFMTTAKLWNQTWRCQPAPVYLENARSALAEAERLGANAAAVGPVKNSITMYRRKSIADRYSLRFDFGYATGRLAPTDTGTSFSHSGAYLSVSPMLRLTWKQGTIGLHTGPYYTYWSAANVRDDGDDAKVLGAKVHEFGARLELALGFKPSVAKYFTLHPGVELGLQYVNYKNWSYSEAQPEFIEESYVNRAGGTVGGSLGLCFVYSALCGMFRVHSSPRGEGVRNDTSPPPIIMLGVGVDFFRLSRASLEWIDSPAPTPRTSG